MMTDSQHGETRSMCFKGPFIKEEESELYHMNKDQQIDVYQTFYVSVYRFGPVYVLVCYPAL